jgi:SAM-dependent methyltransferase
MLALAEGKPAVNGAPITYLENDAASLDVPDAGFDVVTCQQVLQFVVDLPAALAEVRRVIKPGGRLATLTWSSLDRNPMFRVLADTVRDEFGLSAAEAFAKPWSLSEDVITRAVAAAGFTEVIAHRCTLPAVFPGGPKDVCRFFAFSAASADVDALDESRRAAFHKLAHDRLARMTAGGGVVHANTTATVILARA